MYGSFCWKTSVQVFNSEPVVFFTILHTNTVLMIFIEILLLEIYNIFSLRFIKKKKNEHFISK